MKHKIKESQAELIDFEDQKIKGYPQSNKKVVLEIKQFNIRSIATQKHKQTFKTQSSHISPYGMTFHSSAEYAQGDLLKIHVAIPNYWQKKLHFINYTRVNTPKSFPVIGRVINKSTVNQRKNKNCFSVQTLSMDNTDEKVLRCYLEESA